MQGHNIMSLTIRFVSLRVLGSGIPGRPRGERDPTHPLVPMPPPEIGIGAQREKKS
jgi:hypothetical protein